MHFLLDDQSTIAFLNKYFLTKQTKRMYFLQTNFSAKNFFHFYFRSEYD
jgi:hypothetical protein